MHGPYRIYGLRVRSPWKLPAVDMAGEAGDKDHDVVVSEGTVPLRPAQLREDGTGLEVSGDAACYVHSTIGAFCVQAGSEMTVEPAPGAHEDMIRVGILGPALGLALLQRGGLVLHGSAVEVGGRAVAFLGAQGRGKSTMAAAMVDRGHPLLTDDLLALGDSTSEVAVMPGYPRVKLWPDAVRGLNRDPTDLPHLYPGIEKHVLDCSASFARRELPLGRVFILRGGPSLTIGDLPSGEAFMALSLAWFGARFGVTSSALFDRVVHLQRLGELVRTVQVKVLERPQELGDLAAVAHSVEADLSVT